MYVGRGVVENHPTITKVSYGRTARPEEVKMWKALLYRTEGDPGPEGGVKPVYLEQTRS